MILVTLHPRKPRMNTLSLQWMRCSNRSRMGKWKGGKDIPAAIFKGLNVVAHSADNKCSFLHEVEFHKAANWNWFTQEAQKLLPRIDMPGTGLKTLWLNAALQRQAAPPPPPPPPRPPLSNKDLAKKLGFHTGHSCKDFFWSGYLACSRLR
jgi:hypothetical protein